MVEKDWETKLILKSGNSKYLYSTIEVEEDQTPARRILLTQEKGINWGSFFRELKYWLYMISWGFKIYFYLLINSFIGKKFISFGTIKILKIHQKIHFTLFNITVVDILFLGSRTFLHSKLVKDVAFQIIFTGIVYSLAVLDITETIYLILQLTKYSKILFKVDKPAESSKIHPVSQEAPATDKESNKISSFEPNQIQPQKHTQKSSSYPNKPVLLKNMYQSSLIKKYGYSDDEMQAKRFKRVYDYKELGPRLIRNEAVEAHSVAEIKKNNIAVLESKSILLANFLFIIRILLYHLVIVTLANNIGTQLYLLVTIEASYMILILVNFTKMKYLISIIMFFSKFSQSVFLMTFLIICLVFNTEDILKNGKEPNLAMQKVGMWVIISAILFEYLFLFWSIGFSVHQLLKEKKVENRLKAEGKYEQTKELPFVWVRSHQEKIKDLEDHLNDQSVLEKIKNPFEDRFVEKEESEEEEKSFESDIEVDNKDSAATISPSKLEVFKEDEPQIEEVQVDTSRVKIQKKWKDVTALKDGRPRLDPMLLKADPSFTSYEDGPLHQFANSVIEEQMRQLREEKQRNGDSKSFKKMPLQDKVDESAHIGNLMKNIAMRHPGE